jgi:hypothetical protein
MSKTVCLAVTRESVESFSRKDASARGFIHLVDPSFDTSNGPTNVEAYNGIFPIIDQLIWTDLYALHSHKSCKTLLDFWSLGIAHPNRTYVGPTTGVQRKQWRKLVPDLATYNP